MLRTMPCPWGRLRAAGAGQRELWKKRRQDQRPQESGAPAGSRLRMGSAGIFLVISMALSSVLRRINVKDLTSKVSVYTSATELSGGLNMIFRRWATKKTAGSTKNGRDSNPKYLGVKKFGGEKVLPGNIIVRQRGTRFHPGNYVGMGKDHTLFCLKEGHVRFERNKLSGRKWVHVDPVAGHDLHPIYADGFATTADTEPLQ
ncbi:unnamed protein product [Miscanthus lutarioriparius]|uniref:Ribosomal protein L27 n=1 Tax=Miscanthus lutarioriparius TaxID=422564 RepID=A0A811R7F3_9POAL|nr:unnamed protein product [Miscanthus lutarioriparius]